MNTREPIFQPIDKRSVASLEAMVRMFTADARSHWQKRDHSFALELKKTADKYAAELSRRQGV